MGLACELKLTVLIGIPKESFVRVKVNERAKMEIRSLEDEIKKAVDNGIFPIMVIATAGTPTLGAIDSIEDIARICEKHGLWFHVDANRAGATLLSDNQKYRLKGIERLVEDGFSSTT
jgi:glutamate/tyrosine decarboxylase-like PLP-dependent enzyme